MSLRKLENARLTALGQDSQRQILAKRKQFVDKLQLGEWVTYAHPFGSPLPDHMDRFDSL